MSRVKCILSIPSDHADNPEMKDWLTSNPFTLSGLRSFRWCLAAAGGLPSVNVDRDNHPPSSSSSSEPMLSAFISCARYLANCPQTSQTRTSDKTRWTDPRRCVVFIVFVVIHRAKVGAALARRPCSYSPFEFPSSLLSVVHSVCFG